MTSGWKIIDTIHEHFGMMEGAELFIKGGMPRGKGGRRLSVVACAFLEKHGYLSIAKVLRVQSFILIYGALFPASTFSVIL